MTGASRDCYSVVMVVGHDGTIFGYSPCFMRRCAQATRLKWLWRGRRRPLVPNTHTLTIGQVSRWSADPELAFQAEVSADRGETRPR